MIPLIWQGDTGNASPGYTQRANSYGVGGIPHAQFNGYLADVGGGSAYPRYLNKYNNLISQDSPIELNVQFVLNETGEIQLQTNAMITGDITTSNNKLVYIITRNLSNEYFSSVATFDTETFELTNVGEEETYLYDLPIDTEWEIENLSIAVLVQTFDDDPGPNKHKILQGVYHAFTDLMIPITTTEVDFGDVEVGQTLTEQIQITNFFDSPMTIMVISAIGFETEMMVTLSEHSTQMFDITFSPTQQIEYYGDLIVTTDNVFFPNLFITLSGTGIGDNSSENEQVPASSINLSQNYPNPFNPSTKISFDLDGKQDAELIIYNTTGQQIRTYSLTALSNNISWDGKNEMGKQVKSGLYFYQLKTKSDQLTKKMILLK